MPQIPHMASNPSRQFQGNPSLQFQKIRSSLLRRIRHRPLGVDDLATLCAPGGGNNPAPAKVDVRAVTKDKEAQLSIRPAAIKKISIALPITKLPALRLREYEAMLFLAVGKEINVKARGVA